MDDQTPPVVDEPRGSLFSNFVAIIGLIILIVVVIWGLVHLAGLSKNWLTSLFPGSAPKITVEAPANVHPEEPFTVSWKYPTHDQGNYAFMYPCQSGLTLRSSAGTIPCGSAYTVGKATALALTPTFSRTAPASIPLSVIFLPSATSSKQAQGSATITLLATSTQAAKETILAPATTSETKTDLKQSSSVSNVPNRGPADLSVRIVAIGVIDPATGAFMPRAPVYPDDVAAAQFDIANVGGSMSGSYTFSASLPTIGGYAYASPTQHPLAPGDHVLNTLRWTQSAQSGTFSITILAPDNRANNYASATIGLPSQGYYTQPMYYQY